MAATSIALVALVTVVGGPWGGSIDIAGCRLRTSRVCCVVQPGDSVGVVVPQANSTAAHQLSLQWDDGAWFTAEATFKLGLLYHPLTWPSKTGRLLVRYGDQEQVFTRCAAPSTAYDTIDEVLRKGDLEAAEGYLADHWSDTDVEERPYLLRAKQRIEHASGRTGDAVNSAHAVLREVDPHRHLTLAAETGLSLAMAALSRRDLVEASRWLDWVRDQVPDTIEVALKVEFVQARVDLRMWDLASAVRRSTWVTKAWLLLRQPVYASASSASLVRTWWLLGEHVAAERVAAEALALLKPGCWRARTAGNLGWIRVLAGDYLGAKVSYAEAETNFDEHCPHSPRARAFLEANMLVLLARERRWPEVRARLDEIAPALRRVGELALWWELLELQATGNLAPSSDAPRQLDNLIQRAAEKDELEVEWFARIARARLLRARDQPDAALEAYGEMEQRLERLAGGLGIAGGRESVLETHTTALSEAAALLVQRGYEEQALDLLLRSFFRGRAAPIDSRRPDALVAMTAVDQAVRERRRISILLEDATGTELVALKRSLGLATERVQKALTRLGELRRLDPVRHEALAGRSVLAVFFVEDQPWWITSRATSTTAGFGSCDDLARIGASLPSNETTTLVTLRAKDTRATLRCLGPTPPPLVLLSERPRLDSSTPTKRLVVLDPARRIAPVQRAGRRLAIRWASDRVENHGMRARDVRSLVHEEAGLLLIAAHHEGHIDGQGALELRSGHVAQGADQREYLLASDILAAPIRAKRVIVLACSAGKSSHPWSSAALSIAGAFLQSGALEVLAPLRPIEDKEAAEIIDWLAERHRDHRSLGVLWSEMVKDGLFRPEDIVVLSR